MLFVFWFESDNIKGQQFIKRLFTFELIEAEQQLVQ